MHIVLYNNLIPIECNHNFTIFTEEEKARFKSDNLCMRFFYNSTEKVIDENTCYDSIVATVNEDSAISFGFYEYTSFFLTEQ